MGAYDNISREGTHTQHPMKSHNPALVTYFLQSHLRLHVDVDGHESDESTLTKNVVANGILVCLYCLSSSSPASPPAG